MTLMCEDHPCVPAYECGCGALTKSIYARERSGDCVYYQTIVPRKSMRRRILDWWRMPWM